MYIRKRTVIEAVILIVILVFSVPLLRNKIASIFNNKGVSAYDAGQIDEALSYFERSLAFKPDPQVHYNLANVYRTKGMFEEAEAECEDSIRMNPGYSPAYYLLADMFVEREQYKEALVWLKRLESIDRRRAREKTKDVNSEYATFLFQEVSDPESTMTSEQKISRLKKIIDLDPFFVLAYHALGNMYFEEGLFLKAIEYYKQAFNRGLNNATICNSIGISYMRLENYDSAIDYLEQAYEMEPYNIHILYNLASTLRDNGEIQRALQLYKKLISLRYDYPNVHNDIAAIYELVGRDMEAEVEYRNEIDIINAQLPESEDKNFLLHRLAEAYKGLGKYEEARDVIDVVISNQPDYAEALYTRAQINEGMGRIEEAIEDLRKAKSLFPSASFIDDDIIRLERKRRYILMDRKPIHGNVIIYLKNGGKIKGKLKKETDNEVVLEIELNGSVGTVTINRRDIESRERVE